MTSLKWAWRCGSRALFIGFCLHSPSLLTGVRVACRSKADLEQSTPAHKGKMGGEESAAEGPTASVTHTRLVQKEMQFLQLFLAF